MKLLVDRTPVASAPILESKEWCYRRFVPRSASQTSAPPIPKKKAKAAEKRACRAFRSYTAIMETTATYDSATGTVTLKRCAWAQTFPAADLPEQIAFYRLQQERFPAHAGEYDDDVQALAGISSHRDTATGMMLFSGSIPLAHPWGYARRP
jgi:pyrroloquinoline quinone (PQQ) biosynthesis protein C